MNEMHDKDDKKSSHDCQTGSEATEQKQNSGRDRQKVETDSQQQNAFKNQTEGGSLSETIGVEEHHPSSSEEEEQMD